MSLRNEKKGLVLLRNVTVKIIQIHHKVLKFTFKIQQETERLAKSREGS